MHEGGRFRLQTIALLILRLLWLVRGFIDDDVVDIAVRTSLLFSIVPIVLTNYIVSSSRVKRYLEVVFLAASLGIVVYGYLLSGALMLMVSIALIFTFLASAFILSYLLPKIRRENSARK